MATALEVDANTREYLEQIAQIDEALLSAEGEDELNLLNLKNDILDLIQLLRETQKTGTSHTADGIPQTNNNCFQERKVEVDNKSGSKCSAPYEQSWGYCTHHNAVITTIIDSDIHNERMVRVLYTNPIHKKMVPCQYYLSGDCKFDDKNCRFSHGEILPYQKLKKYKEPNFKLLYDTTCAVLVKTADKDIWTKGVSLYINADSNSCRVKLDNNDQIDCLLENIFPIESSGNSSDKNDFDYDNYNDAKVDPKQIDYNPWNLFNIQSGETLGEWEKYTKGIGSRLMEKMGYIKGEGLGSRKQGIINPVSCQILPPGCSLDYCAQLKEQANDGDLFSAEKKMLKMQRKHEKISQENYKREQNKTDLFSFINTQVLASCSSENDKAKGSTPKSKPVAVDLKNHSIKTLNVENFKLGENIRKVEGEITKLNQSLARHKNGTEIYKHVKGMLDAKNKELASLKYSEKSIDNEKKTRKENGKLLIF